MSPVVASFVIPAVLALYFTLYIAGQRIAGMRRLREWAEREGCRIVDAKYKFFGRGPFMWRTAAKKVLFYVTVEYPSAEVKTAWVLVGNAVFGPYSRSIEVKWDHESHNNELESIVA